MFYRRILMLIIALMFLLAGCDAASSIDPQSSAAYEPATQTSDETFTVGIFDNKQDSGFDAYKTFLGRLQGLLRDEGWNITLKLIPLEIPEGQSEDDASLFTIRALAASGESPDAYHVTTDMAKQLRAENLTLDVSSILSENAPMLNTAVKGSFTGGIPGIPVSMNTNTKPGPIGLQLSTSQLNAYGQPIANAEDVLTFLEKQPDAIILDTGWMDSLLIDAWAAQMGYYALFDYGLPVYFYARMDDQACTPVPVEDIAGFYDFYSRYMALRTSGQLYDSRDGDKLDKIAGIMLPLDKIPELSIQVYPNLQGQNTTVCSMEGSYPPPTLDNPVIYRMLAVPTISKKAVAVAKFAQWILLDTRGYDLCNLGKENIDYRFVGDRVEYLRDKEPLTAADFDILQISDAFYRRQHALSYNITMDRFTVYSAANLEKVLADYPPVTPPIWKIEALQANIGSIDLIFSPITQPYQELINLRRSQMANNAASLEDIDKAIEQLKNNRPMLDPIILDLKNKLKEMLP